MVGLETILHADMVFIPRSLCEGVRGVWGLGLNAKACGFARRRAGPCAVEAHPSLLRNTMHLPGA